MPYWGRDVKQIGGIDWLDSQKWRVLGRREEGREEGSSLDN